MKRFLFIFGLLILGAACADQNDIIENETIEQNTYETIEITEIENYVADGYMVVDVREVDEYETGHIPDAINVPLSGVENDEFLSLNKADQYVIICQSGNRSQTASSILSDEGYDVVNVSEGMSSWTGEVE